MNNSTHDEALALDKLYAIVAALDTKFPDGKDIFQRVSRLCEESGELAAAVNHAEGMGIKQEKYGKFDRAAMAKEVQDVLRAALGIASHYNLQQELQNSIETSYRKLYDS